MPNPDSPAHARNPQTDQLANDWFAGFHKEHPEVYKRSDLIREAFAAGMQAEPSRAARLRLGVANAVGLLTEASQLFRFYEQNHLAKVDGLMAEGTQAFDEAEREVIAGKITDTELKAERNGEIARRIEDFLMRDQTPADLVYRCALVLARDLRELIANSEGVAGLHLNGNVADWGSLTEGGEFGAWLGSLDALEVALQNRVGSPGHSALVGVVLPVEKIEPMCPTPPTTPDPIFSRATSKVFDTDLEGPIMGAAIVGIAKEASVQLGPDEHLVKLDLSKGGMITVPLDAELLEPRPGDPVLTLTVNGVPYRTSSTSIRGKLGGIMVRAEWDASSDLKVFIDTPALEAAGLVPPHGIVITDAGRAAVLDQLPDPSHDSGELPRCVLPPEPTVDGVFPGDAEGR